VADLQAEIDEYPEGSGFARRLGFRTVLNVPLVLAGRAIGGISTRRTEARPFTDRQIDLLKTFADQAVIAIENTRLFEEVQARSRDLAQSLEYQTATSEVLKVISRSPSELQHVLDAIVATAIKLCEGFDAIIFLKEGDRLRVGVHHGDIPLGIESMPLGRGWATGRAVIDCAAVHVHDFALMREEFPEGHQQSARDGARTGLAVPLLRDGDAIGAFMIRRKEVRPFSDKQIALLKTFADQAVIAIENTRLFEAEQASKRELQESLEYQTATGEVLGVISRSPTDVQPVFNTIARSAAQLCKAQFCHVFRFDGDLIHFVASHGLSPKGAEAMRAKYPMPPGRASAAARSILTATVEEIPDVDADPDFEHGDVARLMNYRSIVAVPMTKDGRPIGAIVMVRSQAGRFPDRQIDLLKTFADQAVIAIENTRLFEEVQARNSELRVALEQQSATSELLKVIGRSTFDLRPVFETLIDSAVRLCAAERGLVFRFDGQLLRFAVGHNVSPEFRDFLERNPTIAPGRNSNAGRAALERHTVHNLDVQSDPEYSYGGSQVDPYRTVLAVPMLRADELFGVIVIHRHEVRPFTDSQIKLMETFADQAVIALENERLLEELQARNRDLTALGEVGRTVSSTLDLKNVLKTVVERAVDLSATDGGSIFYFRKEIGSFELGETAGLDNEVIARFRELDISARGTGLGEAIATRQPLQIPDLTKRPSNPLRDAAFEAGLRAALIVPLLGSEGPLGALVLQRRQPGDFSAAVVSLMQAFADQSTIALENARLFEEIARKSRELEVASQHKSQFVANMSHELRTPLAAILGYAELIQEGFYGPQPEKSLDALTRIRSNGKHLLGLINTVLDIAKIESGQFSLNMAEYAIDSVVETVRSATESLAQNKKLEFKTDVATPLPIGIGDEQRLTQVLLNLVGNAIKFTDAGEVCVAAGAANGHFTVSVSDTGPGIPAEECERIFEKFRQVDSSNTRAKGGTGLGLAIAREIVQMHGGRIWVESTLGQGSTFHMQLPVRAVAPPGAA
jgi:GAF domain-containing protein